MKKVLLFAAAAIAMHANAQINFGEAPQIKKEVKPAVYDGKHNIDLQNDNGEYNLAHLIGENVTYLGINDKTEFYTNDLSANSEESYWPYKDLDASTMKLKSFRVVDAGLDVLCLFEPGKTDSIFASGDLNTNFIVQKHYDLAKSTCVGKTYRATGLSRRLDFFRDYVTRKPHNASHNNDIPRTEDLKCIDVFVDTVHYDTSMTLENEDWTDNVGTVAGSRLCLLFETPHYGKIFCPVEESEVLDPEHAGNWLNLGPVLTLKAASTSASSSNKSPAIRRSNRKK
ncbi:hypothetical protein PRBRB14_21200 [Hallella multisaccharivorax DSM 17128]|nr:hypothetical protein [Hallella multisaccharivorax]GJG31241.1 hypothetical protein PRBRB14_21200 [Hallella multisaccharivorax DSM 17128]